MKTHTLEQHEKTLTEIIPVPNESAGEYLPLVISASGLYFLYRA
jgi:hypothetical protein